MDPLSSKYAIIEANLDFASLEDHLVEQMQAFSEIESMMDQHQRELPLTFHVLISLSVERLFLLSLTPL